MLTACTPPLLVLAYAVGVICTALVVAACISAYLDRKNGR